MKMKRITALLCAGILGVGMTACDKPTGDDGPNADQTLEIFVVNAGYGVNWLTDTIDAFKNETWVKEKYPNLKVLEPQKNTISGYVDSKITGGLKTNSFDLLFSCQSVGSQYDKKDSSGKSYFEDLYAGVYDATIPGENVKVKDKMHDSVFEYSHVTLLDGQKAYYAMPWINGMMGFMYSQTKIEATLGEDYVMPRTTDEFVQCVSSLKTKLPAGDASFIFAGSTRYFNANFQVWWAQYEGMDQYVNFWNGVDEEGVYSNSIFEQTGRLRALQVCESLVEKDLGYNHELCTTGMYEEVQSKFLAGEAGVFMPVGDWLITESEGFEITQEVRMLKAPVISSIVEKCSTVKTDAALAYVVQCVDEGKTYEQTKEGFTFGDLSKGDFNRISSARNMMYRMTGHEAFIPSYAKGKEVAKDFLVFMASDKGIKSFMKSTYGLQTPYEYEATEDEYNAWCPLQQDHYDYLKTAKLLPPDNFFKLNYLGGLNPMVRCPAILSAFSVSNKKDRKSAQKVYEDDINYFDEGTFNTILQKAGLI